MALSFPLSAAAFIDTLGVREVAFNLEDMQVHSGLGSGDVQSADLAPSRWRAEIELNVCTHAEGHRRMARIRAVASRGETFLLYNPSLFYPQEDLDGALLGVAIPAVDSRDDAWTLSLKDLPTTPYQLRAGDFLSISYSSGRRWLGQFTEDGLGDGSGDLGPVSVVPALPAGVSADDAVTLIKPCGKFKIEPNTAHVSSSGPNHQTIKFSAIQTHEAD